MMDGQNLILDAKLPQERNTKKGKMTLKDDEKTSLSSSTMVVALMLWMSDAGWCPLIKLASSQ